MRVALSPYANWKDLSVGAERELTLGPVTRTDFVRFAAATGDFNPNHHDEIFAIRSGFDRTFAPGPFQGGYVGRLLTEWLGPTALRTFRIRFAAQLWPGDTVTCKAKIVRRKAERGNRWVEIEAKAVNQHGDLLITAHATAVPVA